MYCTRLLHGHLHMQMACSARGLLHGFRVTFNQRPFRNICFFKLKFWWTKSVMKLLFNFYFFNIWLHIHQFVYVFTSKTIDEKQPGFKKRRNNFRRANACARAVVGLVCPRLDRDWIIKCCVDEIQTLPLENSFTLNNIKISSFLNPFGIGHHCYHYIHAYHLTGKLFILIDDNVNNFILAIINLSIHLCIYICQLIICKVLAFIIMSENSSHHDTKCCVSEW